LRKLLTLLISISIIATGCTNPQNYSVTYIDVKSAGENVEKWVEKSSKTNGIYLGKILVSKEGDTYYLYVNYTNLVANKYYSVNEVSIDSGSKNSMIINSKSSPSDEKAETENYLV
jgi:NAD kinase